MTRRVRMLARIAIGTLGLALIVSVTGILVIRTDWFRNYVRARIVSTVEDQTGGKVEMKTFDFDWRGLKAEVTGFVVHGTEPPGEAPLFEAADIVLRLSLFSGWRNIVDLRSLAIDRPSANVIVFPNGQTNIPTPKVARKPGKSGLETVVDLAIGDFEIRNGTAQFLDRRIAFSAHGRDLRVQLNYDPATPHYRGKISIAPLLLASGLRPPLNLTVAMPLELDKDKIQVTRGRIETAESFIDVDASVDHLAAPKIAGQLNAHIALAELARSVDLGMHPRPNIGPQSLDAAITIRSNRDTVEIQQAKLSLGRTQLEASGSPNSTATEIHGIVSLDELGDLFQVSSQPRGDVRLAGNASLSGGSTLVLDGNVGSREISLNHGQWRVKDVALNTTVKFSPNLIEVTNLKFRALGGELTAEARLEKLAAFTANGSLRGFDLQTVAASLGQGGLGYSGTVSGGLTARGNLKSPGRGGVNAEVTLAIAPGKTGTPVSGNVHASYSGARDLISLRDSRISLPSTQIDVSGDIGKQAEAYVVSRNLNDFLPGWELVSPETKRLPVTLRGGVADLVIDEKGPLKDPGLTGHIALTSFAVEDRAFDRLTADLAASPSEATVANGSLTRKTLRAEFSGSLGLSDWSAGSAAPLQATATIQNGDVADLLALAGESDIRASGALNADARITGTLDNPLGSAHITATNGTLDDQPFDQIQASVALSDQLVTLNSAQLTSPAGRVDLRGTFRHPRDSFTTGRVQLHAASDRVQLDRIKPLDKQRPGLAGSVSLNTDIAGDIGRSGDSMTFAPSLVNADLTATGVRDSKQAYGNLTATMRTSGSNVDTHVDSNFGGSTIQLTGRTQLIKDYPTTADATIQGLQVEKALALASPQDFRASGMFSAKAHASGTVEDPHANITFDLAKGTFQDEPISELTGSVEYTKQLVSLPALRVVSPAGTVDLKTTLTHNGWDFRNGHADVHLASTTIDLRRVHYWQTNRPELAGMVRVVADASADLRDEKGKEEILLSRLDATGGVTGITWNQKPLGAVTFQSETKAGVVSLKVDSDMGKSAIHGNGQVRLQRDYPVDAKLTFTNVTYSGLQGLLGNPGDIRPDFDALLEGEATVSGPVLEPKNLRGDLQVSRFELLTTRHNGSPNGAKTAILQNQGPIVAHLERSAIQVQSAHLTGRSSDVTIKGSVALDQQNSFNLNVNASADLAIVKDLYRDAYAGGTVAVDALIRGPFNQPRVNGKVELKKASLNFANFPNGITNANGTISLNGTNATFQNVTAESGGGKVTLNGFAGLAGDRYSYNVRATADRVRTRYSGVSIVSTASLNLTGSTERSVLSGRVTIVKVGYDPESDVGSLLNQANAPPTPPDLGGVGNMRLAVRIQTAPDVRFETSMAQGLDGEADLNLRGTLASPGLVGRISITAGTLIFFGNQYTVNRGLISFYDPLKIAPILDVDLETRAKSVDVILGLSGPIDDLKLTYRSDPPLKFEDIIALLATGRTPPDATIAAHQPSEPEQSTTQMGASAIVGQAIANPVSSRLQRVFGVSQLKIDPSFSSGSTLPQGRVTLQQQVNPSITFTYTTDVTQSNSQIIRVEWALSPRFSAVASRDENGIFGVDFFYKKKFR